MLGEKRNYKVSIPDYGDCEVTFDQAFDTGRSLTFCSIRNHRKIVSGVAVRHPMDTPKLEKGCKVAFSRALDQMIGKRDGHMAEKDYQELTEKRACVWVQLLAQSGKALTEIRA